MTVHYTDEQVTLHLGNCIEVLREIPDASVDAVVCDPPYALANLHPDIVIDALTHWLTGDRDYIPTGRAGFMGADWDGFVPPPAAWDECLRVLKPGGHLLAFAAPRTADLMGLSIRIAGFEIRDSIHWLYGSGFPKGQDIGKAIDKQRHDRADILRVTAWLSAARAAAGWTVKQIDDLFGFNGMAAHWCAVGSKAASAPKLEQWARLREAMGFDDSEILPLVEKLNARKGEIGEAWAKRPVVGKRHSGLSNGAASVFLSGTKGVDADGMIPVTVAATADARRWEGWNTQLRPAHEPIIVARKSTGFNTAVANVLEWGTGALNIGACRTETVSRGPGTTPLSGNGGKRGSMSGDLERVAYDGSTGRWPTNVVFGHAEDCADACAPGCPVAELDSQSGVLTSGANPTRRNSDKFRAAYGQFEGQAECTPARGADSGGASRFFPTFRYEAKAPAAERPKLADGTQHTTVKPLALMRWLVRLVTPVGGVVLDPFAGSGTTLEAAVLEGFNAIGIERESDYADLCVQRLSKPLQPSLFGDAA